MPTLIQVLMHADYCNINELGDGYWYWVSLLGYWCKELGLDPSYI